MFIYFLFLLVLFFSVCKLRLKKTNPKKQAITIHKRFRKVFKLKLKNLHCKLCAYNLVKFISKIEGVTNVKFNYVARNYNQSYFDVEMDKRKITFQDVTVPLIKAGFAIEETS